MGTATAAAFLPTLRCSRRARPNILFAIADDWSWPHASIAGTAELNTPAFDRVAREGVLFTNCYVSAPSCTPSRGAILTGQYHWRLEEGANLWSMLPSKFIVYPDLLEESGYHVGYTGKGWGPGDIQDAGRNRNPAGPAYNQIRNQPPYGMSTIDYAANFAAFLDEKNPDEPFCFWCGSIEPHRVYEYGMGVASGKNPDNVDVPAIFPDSEAVRNDILDYYVEIEHFDSHLGKMLTLLEERGELDNTLVLVTSDNGMPFPRAKSNLYKWGTNMPLAIRWGARVKGGRVIEDFVSQTDFAPTFLQAAGIPLCSDMTGRSLMGLLTSSAAGQVKKERRSVLVGKERHAWVREGGVGYPCRALRTKDFLYIRNFKPERWPAGDPTKSEDNDPPGAYGDIDAGPTKSYMMANTDDPQVMHLLDLAVAKRPAEELYDLKNDPNEINNVAQEPAFAEVKKRLADTLMKKLKASGDPRVFGRGDTWDYFEYYAPRRRALKNTG
ncbi:heparan N-sulfatase [candidate division KSB1 bacterium]|nr:sulfatase [candidate division KSB1 bacterium]RQW03019.1 MAG: heparan N-sulfatase [candidate division KSB1 bacterium]